MVNATRRQMLRAASGAGVAAATMACPVIGQEKSTRNRTATKDAIQRGLDWVAKTQSRLGHWTAGNYPAAMTALAGTALLCSGSTTTQGPYAKNVRRAVDYLIAQSRTNGLIGDPVRDNRYTYGHGFSMLFLSQVLGEEEDADRRVELVQTLKKAVTFSGNAQTRSGGWGYVSAKDGNNFDEGSLPLDNAAFVRFINRTKSPRLVFFGTINDASNRIGKPSLWGSVEDQLLGISNWCRSCTRSRLRWATPTPSASVVSTETQKSPGLLIVVTPEN